MFLLPIGMKNRASYLSVEEAEKLCKVIGCMISLFKLPGNTNQQSARVSRTELNEFCGGESN
jgi:hypothetical protein